MSRFFFGLFLPFLLFSLQAEGPPWWGAAVYKPPNQVVAGVADPGTEGARSKWPGSASPGYNLPAGETEFRKGVWARGEFLTADDADGADGRTKRGRAWIPVG